MQQRFCTCNCGWGKRDLNFNTLKNIQPKYRQRWTHGHSYTVQKYTCITAANYVEVSRCKYAYKYVQLRLITLAKIGKSA